MNYIIFDLEWNQCPKGPDYENPRLPFEIIEIGAVKLNDSFEITDEFSRIIKPRVYTYLHNHIRQMLNYDEDYLKTGDPFEKVCKDFMKWCGSDYIFGTWGDSDLPQLQKNMDYYYIRNFSEPFPYYNIQSIFAEYHPDLGPCRLEKAVSALNLPKEEHFHTAINDARYTANIFRHLSKKYLSDQYSYDYYHAPADKDAEIFAYHRFYSEYISRGFDRREDIMEDKEIAAFRCYKCRRRITKKIKWFSYNQTSFVGAARCWYHGYQKGTIKIKTAASGKLFAIKTVVPITKTDLDAIRRRQDDLRQKRKERRNNHNR